MFFCFKQFSVDIKQKFEPPYHLLVGEKPLSVVVWEASVLVEKPLDFYNTTFFSIV